MKKSMSGQQVKYIVYESCYTFCLDLNIGCVIGELLRSPSQNSLLFQSSLECEVEQLFVIFKALGTPAYQSFYFELFDAKVFPKWLPRDILRNLLLRNDDSILWLALANILEGMLQICPAQRYSANHSLRQMAEIFILHSLQ